jgi:hypothetical protein
VHTVPSKWKKMLLMGTTAIAGAANAAVETGACRISSPPQTQVLVELYTSQGCSSCPPADRWLSQLDVQVLPGVVPLSLHVGYWDYIGWKDPYARREFNQRQRWLADLNRNRTVYTPGVFVQAHETPRWSEMGGFKAATRAITAQPARAKIDLVVEAVTGDAVRLRAETAVGANVNAAAARLFVALTESGLDTKVKAGENRGATLHNDHVVRDWSGPLVLGRQTVALSSPGAVEARRAVVAFVQDTTTGEVLQALRLSLAGCTP